MLVSNLYAYTCNFNITKKDIRKIENGGIFISQGTNGIACLKNLDDRTIYYPIKNGTIEGRVILYHYGDVIETSIPYKNGKKEGIAKQFYPSGAILIETPYKNNKREGILKEYYETGELNSEITYKNDKANGIRKDYYIAGTIKQVMHYKDDYKHGKVVHYHDPKGVSLTVTYNMGVRDSDEIEYFPNGKIKLLIMKAVNLCLLLNIKMIYVMVVQKNIKKTVN